MAASKVYRLIWRAMPALAAGLIGCASRGSDTLPTGRADNPQPPAGAPSLSELQQQLDAELQRLGIDPTKVTAAAPKGERNAVFDLSATLIDPDGPGGSPPNGVELSWTERLLGDYDQNGEVNAADLAPIASRFQQTVSYDAPALHGGFAEWPSGDPEGSGAANWRHARADGDGNGEINAADIATIAGHFKEVLSGYRIYRRLAGQSGFEPLRHQGQPLLIPRPGASAEIPVNYAFLDEPPVVGEYDYYVIAVKTQAIPVEASHGSNIASAQIDVGFADTLPPVWDDTVGPQPYTDNGDGTATLSWGTATDEAPLGVLPSEPVTYTVLWSTQTPINFEQAAKVELVSSPWTSPQLLSGTPYYFAVRASDSADPPNTEENTVELEVSVTGGATEDTEPPVWVEISLNTNKLIKGIREIEPLDGKLIIRHAIAEDALSPPVHYDLYVISDQIADSVLDENDNIRAEAQQFSDIPPEFELTWANRDAAHLLVRARDSAAIPNTEENDKVISRAPGAFTRHIIDPNIPGIYPETERIWEDKVVDHAKQRAYFVYHTTGDHPNDEKDLWFINLDLKTGTWTSKLLQSAAAGSRLRTPIMGLSWTGDLWIRCSERFADKSVETTFHILRKSGISEKWETIDPPDGWYSKNFDHNGNPLILEMEESSVQPNRYKLIYKWWDSATQAWIEEVAVDPGTVYSLALVRPDGTVQLLVSGEAKPLGGDDIPEKARVAERSPNGDWSIIYEAVGNLNTNSAQYSMVTWDHEIAWSAGAFFEPTYSILTYGSNGYTFSELPIFNGEQKSGRAWPAEYGKLHLIPTYISEGGGYFKQSLVHINYADQHARGPLMKLIQSGLLASFFNPISGDFANVSIEPNLTTGQYQWVLQRPAPGKSLFVR